MSGIVNTSTAAQRVLWRERFESRLSKQPDGCWIWTALDAWAPADAVALP